MGLALTSRAAHVRDENVRPHLKVLLLSNAIVRGSQETRPFSLVLIPCSFIQHPSKPLHRCSHSPAPNQSWMLTADLVLEHSRPGSSINAAYYSQLLTWPLHTGKCAFRQGKRPRYRTTTRKTMTTYSVTRRTFSHLATGSMQRTTTHKLSMRY